MNLQRTVTKDRHYNPRGDSICATIRGGASGIIVVGTVLLGVAGEDVRFHTVLVVGVTTLIAGILASFFGEFVSVASQRDSENHDIRRELKDHSTEEGRQHELLELRDVYVERGLNPALAQQVAIELTEKDCIGAHVRDELGLQLTDLSNPWKAALLTTAGFAVGGAFPLLGSLFIHSGTWRIVGCVLSSSVGLLGVGATAARAGGANTVLGALRVMVFGWVPIAAGYGVGRGFGH